MKVSRIKSVNTTATIKEISSNKSPNFDI
jgi:hypothetical protein